MRAATSCLLLLLALAGCATTPPTTTGGPGQEVVFGAPDFLGTMGRVDDAEVTRRVEAAARHPLGSTENPVRANLPQGQHAYLRSLRCSDGTPPEWSRAGNVGPGVYGSIVDRYVVRCSSGQPSETSIFMDMYHPDHRETAAPPGFTLVSDPSERPI